MNTQKDKELKRAIKEFTGHAASEREYKLVLLALAFILSVIAVIMAAFFLIAKWMS